MNSNHSCQTMSDHGARRQKKTLLPCSPHVPFHRLPESAELASRMAFAVQVDKTDEKQRKAAGEIDKKADPGNPEAVSEDE